MTESRLYHKLVRQRLTFRSLDGGRAELKFSGWRKIRDMLPSDIVRSVTSICIHISRRKQQGRHAASTCQDRVVDQHVRVKLIHPRLSSVVRHIIFSLLWYVTHSKNVAKVDVRFQERHYTYTW